jgi:divalent metal cation (Fe/Co/Zn/Cd) transporter
LNPGRRGGKPATNRFSYGAAKERTLGLACSSIFILSLFMLAISCVQEQKMAAVEGMLES